MDAVVTLPREPRPEPVRHALVLAENGCVSHADALVRGLTPRVGQTCRAPTIESVGLDALERAEVPEVVAIVVRARDEELALHDLDTTTLRERVSDPLRAIFGGVRAALDRWMEEGTGGLVVIALVVNASTTSPSMTPSIAPSIAPSLIEAALTGFVRSVSKEHGRRGVRALLIVSDAAGAEAVAEVARLVASPEGALVTGETLRVTSA